MTTQEVKRKLTAILSADVKGYSRLMGEDEESTARTLNTYKEVMADLIQIHHGRVVDAPGDNVLAEFASVVDAVRCAVEIQKELKTRNVELPENRRMEFRIGVNLGDVIEDGEQILGDGVNIAARVQGLADGGGICISGTAYDHVENKLSLGYQYLGEQTVKNIAKPVRVYRVLMEPEAVGKVYGVKKPRHWQRAILGLVVAVIAIAAAVMIWKFYISPTPQREVVSNEKVAVPQPEKSSLILPPSAEPTSKEKVPSRVAEKPSKVMTPPPPKMEVAIKEKMAFSLPDKPSIVVLPFTNLTRDPTQEPFCDGLSEEIITALSKIPQLFVIASNTTFTYKGKPVKVKQVSEELGVRYVLEGSVRRAGDRIRITAQLIDAMKGHHLWAERYDRDIKDLLAVQEDITKRIITAVHVELTDGEMARALAKGTSNLHAYLKATEGMWHILQSTKEGALRARQLAEEAISLDPNYAYAYMTLGFAHGVSVWLGISPSPAESMKRCIELMEKSVALDPSSGEAHAGLGYWLVLARQYEKAVSEGERGMALEPNSAGVLHNYAAILTFVGRYEEAIPLFREALRLNPKPPNSYYRQFGIALRDSGRYEEAIALQKKAIEREPNDTLAYVVLASSCQLAGREEEARAAAKELLRVNPAFSLERLAKTTPHKDREVAERFIEALRRAGLK
jgi:TolB-like protein/class 3 adenylate cyclase/cytochrome c-type biogenesis protein CcmH/NrfG